MKQDKLIMEEEKRKEVDPDRLFEKRTEVLEVADSGENADNGGALVVVESVRWYVKVVRFFRGLFGGKS